MSITWYRDIVAGVDGSEESLAAVDWAVRTADAHDARLSVVATYAMPRTADPRVGDVIGEIRAGAHRAAEAARTRIGTHRPGGHDVEVTVLPGSAAYVLGERSRSCDLAVVGRRGLGKVDRMLLGSTSSALAASAPGAVAVVPAGASTGDPRRIRVGVGRDDEPDALGAAFAEADARGCPLEVLHVTSTDPLRSAVLDMDPVAASWHEATKAALDDRVARWSEKYPRVTCSIVVRRGDEVGALLDGLTADELLVVGGRRHSRAMGRVLGSVADAVLRSAPCPVVVVHAHHHPES